MRGRKITCVRGKGKENKVTGRGNGEKIDVGKEKKKRP